MEYITITQNLDQSLDVMHDAGEWMQASGMHPNEWWTPEHMNRTFMLQHAEPKDFYVLLNNGIAAASVVLQDTERNQSWKFIDKKHPQKALYIHWLAVKREFAGQGLSDRLIDFAKQEARKRGLRLLRLDTHANQPKLCALYEGFGFERVGTQEDTAYYEKKLNR